MNSDIKYPLAILKSTNEIIHAKNVSNGKVCGCICSNCIEDLIAYKEG